MNQLLGATKAKILNHLLERKMTAGELSALLDIQVSAARKHLETLKGMKVVSVQFSREGLGRPKKFYVLTGEGRELFPRQYDAILNAIIKRLLSAKETGIAKRIVRQVASDLVKQLDLGGSSSKEHMELLVAGLNKFGFAASVEENENQYKIVSRNCPLHRSAMANPELICEDLHGEILKRATGSSIKLTSCVMAGDTVCTHIIQR